MNERLLAAASARAAGVQQRSHRPQQRRWAEESEGIGTNRASFQAQINLRAAEASPESLHFTGYASVYERGYEMWDWYGPYTEIVSAGAAAESLARANLDVPLVLAHDSLRRIARTTNGSLLLSEDDNGLLVDAPELDQADADVAYIAPKLRSGLVDEMSFMFRITAGHWSPDYTEYRIDAFDIHRGDVAIVGYGASPHTAGSGLRSAGLEQERSRMRSMLDLAIAAD
jgi:HK97 family phage prohead protease